jgi:Carboxypeptidase regulatory-like domain/TonB-dependent Receptor Plug Domain
MNMIKTKFLLVSVATLCIFSSIAFGQQEYGQLSGTVKDPNDAIVPGATVKIVNTANGVEKNTTTNSDGYFLVTNLFPSEYTVTVSSTGFKEQVVKAQISVGGSTSINIKLGVQENINVVDVVSGGGGIAEINTTDQTQSNVVTSRQLTSLPVLDRNPYNLVSLAGNISTADPSGRGAGVSINGQRSASTDILLDGTENSATFTANIAQSVPLEAVGEYRIITSNFSAEYGRASGGIVNVITSPGGNSFKGNVFEQNRNSVLSSNGYDNNANAIARPNFNRNQYGFTLSGPIVKNKLFFNNSAEFIKVRSFATQQAWVPTPAFIATTAITTRNFFSSYGTLKATPTGIVAGGFQLVRYQQPTDVGGGTPQNSFLNAARVDWNVSDKMALFVSYKVQKNNPLKGTGGDSPYAGYDFSSKDLNQNIQLSGNYNFTNNLIFDAKMAYRQTTSTPSLGTKPAASPTLYLFNAFGASFTGAGVTAGIAFPGYLPFSPGAGLPIAEKEQLLDFKPNLQYIRGNHNFRIGGQYVHLADAAVFGAYQGASETLSSAANFNSAINNLIAGNVQLLQVAIDPQGKFPGGILTLPVKSPNFKRSNVYNESAYYVNDSWRIKSNLTLNLGVRYEYYGAQKSKEGLDSNFYFGSGNTIYERIRNGSAQISSTQGGLWKPDKNNFAPRVGFAWDIFGNGKTSFRGGYGISYERNFGNVTFNVIQNPPFYAVVSTGPLPIATDNFGPLAGSTGTLTLPRSSLRAVDPNIVNAYAHHWGASFERQVASNTVAKFEYSGSAGRSLYSISNINRAGTGLRYLNSTNAGFCPTGLSSNNRLNCQYSNINFRGSDGTSNYYSFTSSLESNNFLKTGLAMTARYTYAVNKDDLSSTFSESTNNFNLGYTDPFNPKFDYGYSDSDVRHRFIGSFIYPFPFKFENGVAKAVLGGWTLTNILEIRSGAPFTLYDSTNCLITTCIRAENNPGNLVFNHTRIPVGANSFNFIDLSAYTPSAFTDVSGATEVGPFPTNLVARNSFRRPGLWNLDSSIFKDIQFSERLNLRLKFDVFNLFNHANLRILGTSADVANGFVNAFKDGKRTAQVSAKFSF